MKLTYNDYAKVIDSCDIIFGTDDLGKFPKMAAMISQAGMVTRAPLRWARDFLTPGKCSRIKPVAMVKLMSLPPNYIQSCYNTHLNDELRWNLYLGNGRTPMLWSNIDCLEISIIVRNGLLYWA